ncbi:hypothetical protein MMC22_003988 [Lobaria immixta]|nr:hypothetical protein [Lobaria immixta]
MAGVGEAASIAGLITVAGQCLDLLSKLYTLVKAFQDVFPQARKLADELTLLRQCLSQIQNIASRAVNIVPDLSEPVTALFTTVSRCENTVCQIEQKIQTIHPSKKKLIWNRVKVAAARDFFTLLQAQVLSEKQDLILRLDAFSCELDLRTSCNIEHLAASTSSLERNLIDMMQHLGGHSGATERHLLALDARMQTMQQMLEHSISPQRRTAMTPRSRRMQLKAPRHVSQIAKELELPGSRILSRIREPASESVRLISPAFLVYEKNGTAHTELVALSNGELNRLNVAEKNRMIQYLQSLRLFMWLLKRDNYLTTNSTKDLGMIRSSLAVQAGITSFWEFSNAYSDLATSLDEISHKTLLWLLWLRNTPWLQYVFDRIVDRRDGEKVMEPCNGTMPCDDRSSTHIRARLNILHVLICQDWLWSGYDQLPNSRFRSWFEVLDGTVWG